MAAHSSVLAWRIPGPGEPGGLPSLGLHRVGHDWSDAAAAAAAAAVWSTPYHTLPLFSCVTLAQVLTHSLPQLFFYLQNGDNGNAYHIRLPKIKCDNNACCVILSHSGSASYYYYLAVLSCSVVSDSLRPVDCSPPGTSVHGDSPSKNTGVGCHAPLQGIFPTQGWNPGLLHFRWILYCLTHQGSSLLLLCFIEKLWK